MTTVPPINPALLAALQQALDQFPAPQAPLVSVAASLVSAPQALQAVKTQQVLSGVVQQVVQTAAAGDVVEIATQRGAVTLSLPELDAAELPQGTPLKLVLTPQAPTAQGSVLPPLAQLVLEENLVKRAQAAHPSKQVLGSAPLGQGVSTSGGGKTVPTPPPMLGASLLNVLQQNQQQPAVTQTPAGGAQPLLPGHVVRAALLNTSTPSATPSTAQTAGGLPSQAMAASPAAGTGFLGGMLGKLGFGATPPAPTINAPPLSGGQAPQAATLPLHVLQLSQTGETAVKPAVPLGQVGLSLQVQTKLPNGQVTALVTEQSKPLVATTGQTISLVGQRVVFPAAPVATGQIIFTSLPEQLEFDVQGLSTSLLDISGLQSKPPALETSTPKLTANALLMMAALNALPENASRQLGQLAASLSERIKAGGKIESATAAKDALEILARKAEGDDMGLNPATGWRATPLPNNPQSGILAAWLHLHIPEDPHHHRGQTAEENKQKKETDRFVFDLSLSRMGQMQIDGLVRDKNLNVVVRSEQGMSVAMQSTLTKRFIETLESNGLEGGLRFAVVPPQHPEWQPWAVSAPAQETVDHANLTA